MSSIQAAGGSLEVEMLKRMHCLELQLPAKQPAIDLLNVQPQLPQVGHLPRPRRICQLQTVLGAVVPPAAWVGIQLGSRLAAWRSRKLGLLVSWHRLGGPGLPLLGCCHQQLQLLVCSSPGKLQAAALLGSTGLQEVAARWHSLLPGA